MSMWELGLIALVALIVIGPKRIPEVVRQCGRWWVRMRKMRNSIKAEGESLLKEKPKDKADEDKGKQ